MNDTKRPTVRSTAVLVPGPPAGLRCSNCGGALSDADAECPTCASPIDWGASQAALRSWAGARRA